MKRVLIGAAFLFALICAVHLSAPRRAPACSIDPAPFARMPKASHLIVVPTDRLVSSARRLPPHLAGVRPLRGWDETYWQPGRWWWWQARIARWFRRLRDRPPYGQIAVVEAAGGQASGLVPEPREVVIVDWNTTGMCGVALRPERTPALQAHQRLFLTATLRDTAHWVAGMPTFDFTIDHFSHYEHEHWKPPTDRDSERMSARQVLSVYESLPEYDALKHHGSQTTLAPLFAWIRAHPTLAKKYPARRMISNTISFAVKADSIRLGLHPYQTRLR